LKKVKNQLIHSSAQYILAIIDKDVPITVGHKVNLLAMEKPELACLKRSVSGIYP